MIFELFFKKRMENRKNQLNGLYSEIRSLKDEIAVARDEINFKEKRFERVMHLLNNRVSPNAERRIELTKKNVYVLTATKANEFEIEMFDLDEEWPLTNQRSHVLWAYERTDHFYVKDNYLGPGKKSGKGRGEMAMNILLDHIERINNDNKKNEEKTRGYHQGP